MRSVRGIWYAPTTKLYPSDVYFPTASTPDSAGSFVPDAASRLTHPSQCRLGVAASSHTFDHADVRKSTEVCEAHEDTCMCMQ